MVRIPREAELGTADVDELLKRLSHLFGVADDDDARSRPDTADAAPEVRGEAPARLHPRVRLGLLPHLVDHPLLLVARVRDELLRETSGLVLGLAHDHL